ncbi:hypothetical protein KFU94_11885 [Chloroflexi bacterium TSY]|nr:hypothetical protein [Chloroflexi bacterium TSY]
MDKLLCDIEHILPGCVGQPAVLSHILILQDPAKTPSIKPNDGPQTVSIVFDRMDACFMTQLAATDSLDYLDCDLYKGYPIARFTGSSSAAIVSAVEELCYQHQVLMLDVIKRHEGRPDFSMPARMEPIPKSEAIIELLRHFQGGHKSVLLQEQTDASSVHLFMELAALIEDAQCHRLFVGPLEQMIDLVSRLPTASKDWRSK